MTPQNKHKNCGFVNVGYPVDTSGDSMLWKCECETSACTAPKNYFEEMYKEREEKEMEEMFYKKVFKTELL